MQNKLIILRGPSGAGKSTVARALQNLSHADTLIIDQDYYRHTLLDNKPDDKNLVPELIEHNAHICLQAGYNVIIEGIFRKEKYARMFQKLIEGFTGESYTYYFNISFDETAKRHATRDKAALFTSEKMKEWYSMAEPLGISQENEIPEHMSEAEIIQLIRNQTGL